LKRLEEAFDEAINSTKAAAVEEIVPGGGTALLRAIEAVEAEERSCEGADRTGVHVVRMALEVPTRQIARNAGIDDGPVVEMVRSSRRSARAASTICSSPPKRWSSTP
jgi:chaperonin GroEL